MHPRLCGESGTPWNVGLCPEAPPTASSSVSCLSGGQERALVEVTPGKMAQMLTQLILMEPVSWKRRGGVPEPPVRSAPSLPFLPPLVCSPSCGLVCGDPHCALDQTRSSASLLCPFPQLSMGLKPTSVGGCVKGWPGQCYRIPPKPTGHNCAGRRGCKRWPPRICLLPGSAVSLRPCCLACSSRLRTVSLPTLVVQGCRDR